MTIKKIKYLFLLLSIFSTGKIIAQSHPGIISQIANTNGTYAQFGPPSGFLSPQTNLRLGNNKIETYKLNLTQFVVKLPTLHLNPLSGNVTIGPTDGDFAALTIRSYDETKTGIDIQVDLSLEGHGRIGAQGSVYIQLDDNGNADEYFSIKGSDWEDIFYVGENGQHRLNGDLLVDGNITVTGTVSEVEEFKVITGHSLNEIGGDVLFADIRGSYADDSDTYLRGHLDLPDGATITKIEITYKDDSPYDIDVSIFSAPAYSGSSINSEFEWDSSGNNSSYRTALLDGLNIVIDNENRLYSLSLLSGDWGHDTIAFKAMKVYYTR